MRLMAVVGTICALSQTAAAQSGDCSAIADAAAKLACYNNEPPRAPARAATARPAARPSTAAAKPLAPTTDSTKYIDKIGDEDAIVSAKMRSICRGC